MVKTNINIVLVMLLSGAALFTSCHEDFDWDDAHANTAQKKYSDTFFKEFGKPVDGHQWGFDVADFVMGGSQNISETRAVYKQDMGNPRVTVAYGKPKDITQKEHDEVYAWFSNHKVTWTDNPTDYQGTSTRQTSDNIAHVINSDYPNYGSLKTAAYGNVLGDYTLLSSLGFHNAWIQHVNSNTSSENVQLVDGQKRSVYKYQPGDGYCAYDETLKQYIKEDNNGNVQYNGSEPIVISKNGHTFTPLTTSLNKSGQMNFLYSWGLSADGSGVWQEHLNDFNNGHGYGYGDQNDQNAILVTDAAIDTWTYDNSSGGSKKHDKYYIVYLKGDGYEGWYLGFDFESWGNTPNERLKADGICNDWIIKICDVGNSIYNPARIMCEDLGGSLQTTTTHPQASDIDYNDLVLDIQYTGQDDYNGEKTVTLTLQAAGGTLPLGVFYEINGTDVKLFETHEFFNGKVNELVTKADYETMINTKGASSPLDASAKTADKPAKVYTLFFKTEDGYNPDNSTHKYINENFSFNKIKIKVYRRGVDDYIANSVSSSTIEADWVNLDNIDGEAPLKICVPNTTKWMQERVKITDGYPDFRPWVTNPAVLFWNTTKTGLY